MKRSAVKVRRGRSRVEPSSKFEEAEPSGLVPGLIKISFIMTYETSEFLPESSQS